MRAGGASWVAWVLTILLTIITLTVIGILIVVVIDYQVDNKVGLVVKGYVYGISPPYPNNPCYDGLPCTRDIVLHDQTCVHRDFMMGYNCSVEDICYYPQTTPTEMLLYPKYCCNGVCVSNRSRCIGVCPSDGIQIDNASTCSYAMFPVNYEQFQNVSLSCIFGSCSLLTIQTYTTASPLTDANVYNTSQCPVTIAFALSKCIKYDCTVSGDNASVFCVFRYRCATFDFGDNILDSSLGRHSDSKSIKKESYNQQKLDNLLKEKIVNIREGKKTMYYKNTGPIPSSDERQHNNIDASLLPYHQPIYHII